MPLFCDKMPKFAQTNNRFHTILIFSINLNNDEKT